MVERLHAEWRTSPTVGGVPLVLLHGFTQTARAWGRFGDELGPRPTLAIDLPGHGGSSQVRADLADTADLVAATLTAEGARPATVLGYSMGGRVALHLALQHPEVVHELVLVSTTAGIDDADERAARRADDERLADRVEDIGVDAFLDEWLARPLFASLDDDAAGRDERRRNTTAGLASSLRLAGAGTQEPLWDRLAAIDVPTLVVVGGLDAKFTALGRRLVDTIGSNATLVVIPDAGHNAPLETPGATAAAMRAWATPAI